MKEIYLLDCTLRDGGYINDWRFGCNVIRSVIARLDSAGIDIIECGFIDSNVEYDKDRTLFPDIPSVKKTLGNALLKQSMIVAMIDFGTFDREMLIPQYDSVLDGIRLIFKKEDIDAALEYGHRIKELGYRLFLNPVALPSYHNIELIQLIDKINDVQPFGMSMVDSYGLMYNKDIEKYIALVDDELDAEIALGYHCHNNLQMANAHCISFINKNLNRKTIVDASILGMGKNAGNACTELLTSWLTKSELKIYSIDHVLDCAYTDIMKFNTKSGWGYGLDSLLSAINDCSPNWTKFLMNKNTLSVKGIRTILESLPYEKREVSYFSKTLAEQKYLEYMDRYIDDSEAKSVLSTTINTQNVLLLCPGKTLNTHHAIVEQYISDNNPIVITVNFIADTFSADYAFISNPQRYSQMVGVCSELLETPQLLVTSNIVAVNTLEPTFVLNYKTLYEKIKGDSSAGLLICLLKDLGVTSVAIAGMDGYDERDYKDSFFDANMVPGFNSDVHVINQILTDQLRRVIYDIDVQWITPSIIKEALTL